MSAVGIFAGRGDVVLAMGMAVVLGIAAGYQIRRFVEFVKRFRAR